MIGVVTHRLRAFGLAVAGLLALGGCEAPLNLQKVEEEQARSLHRFDHLKSMAASDSHVVIASDAGVLLVSDQTAESWQRIELPTKASFLNLAVCPNGRFAAVDTRRTLWLSNEQAADWQANPIDTYETLMALGCDASNRIWVGASFSTLLRSDDFGKTWTSTSQDEDLQFTAINFFADSIVAAGEFGTVMFSADGESWERSEPLPNEFYPMGLHFSDRNTGYVSGLGGTIFHTADGGQTWGRQDSESPSPLYNFATLGERLFALGDNGSLLELKGERWARVPNFEPIPTYLIDAVGLKDGRLLMAGGGGTVIGLKPATGE